MTDEPLYEIVEDYPTVFGPAMLAEWADAIDAAKQRRVREGIVAKTRQERA